MLAGTLDAGDRSTGLLIVSGGNEIRVGAHRGIGDLLAEGDGADDDDRRLVAVVGRHERVERRNTQADKVRRGREMRLVGDPAAGVEAHEPRLEPLAQIGDEVASLAIVAGDHERRAIGAGAVGQGRDEVRAQRLRHERAAAVADERGAIGVFMEA